MACESLPAQRDGKFTVGLTQILFTGHFWPFNGNADLLWRSVSKVSMELFELYLYYFPPKNVHTLLIFWWAFVIVFLSFYTRQYERHTFVLSVLLAWGLTTCYCACFNWTNDPLNLQLFRYMRLYGRKFSKEDHVLFIKLLYELVMIPKLEISMMQGLARLLINLLK